ncbi:MAG: flagellar motor switch phosphatase FliY [Clostridiales bacterium]|nr:flagellar motor switch phosphatase FliY [Clostridiales bacterium]
MNKLSQGDLDALREISALCMGTSAAAMGMLLGREVSLSSPRAELYRPEDVPASSEGPFLAVTVEAGGGLRGKSLLLFKVDDAALIADLLMGGGDEGAQGDAVLTELRLGAVREAARQMAAAAAAVLSSLTHTDIELLPSRAVPVDTADDVGALLDGAAPLVGVGFDMELEGALRSTLFQLIPAELAGALLLRVRPSGAPARGEESGPERPAAAPPSRQGASALHPDGQGMKSVQPARYESFDALEPDPPEGAPSAANFDLINDIPLQVTVELGKTRKSLSDIMNVGVGSVIVLDKQAGDLVEVIVNGKRIARGEVVVIDENYGVRITELLRN